MKHTILIALIFLSYSCVAQEKKSTEFTYENFGTEILNYEPVQKESVSSKDFKNGLLKLKATKTAVKNDASQLNSADFWNITMAFLNIKESKSNIEISFQKAISFKNNNICSYINVFGPSGLDETIPELFYKFYNNCKQDNVVETQTDLKAYSTKNKLNYELILLIQKIKNNDNHHRNGKDNYYEDSIKLSEQQNLDSRNQNVIDSLYSIHKSYLGKALVGEKFSSVMWAVVQHSNIEMMSKYIPVVQKAVKENELDVVPFKMLIDRFYGLKYGYQVFGSQSGFGFELADDKKKKEIEIKYGIK
jgi:hypothetical protein